MKIPTEIATIITQIGVRNLTFSEKRKLVGWYHQLNRDSTTQLNEEETTAMEEKIFSAVQKQIERKSNPSMKSKVFCLWFKRLLPCYLIVQDFIGSLILFE